MRRLFPDSTGYRRVGCSDSRPAPAAFPGLILVGLLCLVHGCSARASALGPVFRTIGVADGLPDSRVETMVQDRHGYIWMGTQSGLVRYESGRLHVIGSDPTQPDPLPGRNIMALLAHSDGTVWAAVEDRGVVQIGPGLEARRHLDHPDHGGSLPADNIWSMAEDCQGRVWLAFAQSGVAVFDPADDQVRHFPQNDDTGLPPGAFQLHTLVDSACRLWVVQSRRILLFEPEQSRFRTVFEAPEGQVPMFIEEVGGEIVFGMYEALLSFGPVERAHRAEPQTLADLGVSLTGVASDPLNGELVATTAEGLMRWSKGSFDQKRRTRAAVGLSDGLPSSRLYGLMFDHEGGLWLRTFRSGVAYMAPGTTAFERYQHLPGDDHAGLGFNTISALGQGAHAGALWVGSHDGIIQRIDLNAQSQPEARMIAWSGPITQVIVAIRQRGDRLAVATQSRVLLYPSPDAPAGDLLLERRELDDGTIRSLRWLDDQRLWVTTADRGLFLLDVESGQRRHFHPDAEGVNQLPFDEPVALLAGPRGDWWVAGEDALLRWREGRGFGSELALPDAPLSAAYLQDETLWTATDDRVRQWHFDGERLRPEARWDLTGGLPPGQVLDIFPDEHGVLWLVRSSGLAMLRMRDGHLRHLTGNDGLPGIDFQRGASVKLPDGRIAAGGQGGIVVIHPDQVRGIEAAPEVHVTRLQAGDRVLHLGESSQQDIILDHDSNSLFFDYLSNSFVAPDRNRYRLRLEGWDDDWLELIGQTRHFYSNLPPGDYRFQVQAASPDGPWNEAGDAVAFTIERPPWLSTWAIAAYAILGLGGAGAGVQGYRRSQRRRREFREVRQKRQLAEEQRQVIERLNRSLEPLDLAVSIAREVLRLTGGTRACIGFVDERLPRDIVCTEDHAEPPSRQEWRRGLEAADGERRLAVNLHVAQRDVARVLVEAGDSGFHADHAERLPLFEEMAGQALHNAMLLQRVRALAERAEQASSAKSEFLATMSHEIRTPLHGVLGMVDLLYETETEPGQQDILDTLRQSGQQLQRIIDDVLDISRIEAGRLSLSAQPFDLAATLEQVVDLHAPNAARKGLDLRLRIASDLPLIAVGDSARMTQVLGNLLSNAVKFTDRGGIELVAEIGADRQLVLIVADSGPGIGAEDRERLFEPFTQLDASITRSHSGSGLGLAICRRLVDAMGGTLDLMPPCHRGSRFRVRLPVFEQAFEPPAKGMTSLLDDLVVCACLSAPELRVLRRLGRRWNLTVIDARAQPRRCGLLLVDPLALDETEAVRLDDWRGRAEALAWLQSPFATRRDRVHELPEDAFFLRWPLVESRLIGLLLDLRLTRR